MQRSTHEMMPPLEPLACGIPTRRPLGYHRRRRLLEVASPDGLNALDGGSGLGRAVCLCGVCSSLRDRPDSSERGKTVGLSNQPCLLSDRAESAFCLCIHNLWIYSAPDLISNNCSPAIAGDFFYAAFPRSSWQIVCKKQHIFDTICDQTLFIGSKLLGEF